MELTDRDGDSGNTLITDPLLPRAPRSPRRIKKSRPSAVRCGCVLCGLIIGAFVLLFLGTLVYGLYIFVDGIRHPHKSLYHGTFEAKISAIPGVDTHLGSEADSPVRPFIGLDTPFDVYVTVWARLPETEAAPLRDAEAEEAERVRLGDTLNELKRQTELEDVELLSAPRERAVWQDRVFEGLTMAKAWNLHKDIELDLPLHRFTDQYVYAQDARIAVSIIPSDHDLLRHITNASSCRPDTARPLTRLSDESSRLLDLTGAQRSIVDSVSISYPLVSLLPSPEQDEERRQEANEGKVLDAATRTARFRRPTEVYQPYWKTKSHAYIMDETREMNRTEFERRHNRAATASCGQAERLAPHRLLCDQAYEKVGVWGLRLEVEHDTAGANSPQYAPYVGVLKHSTGPRDLFKLPVQRNGTVKIIEQDSIRVHHQLTFSALSAGRVHALDNFGDQWTRVSANATEAERVQAHADWEQFNGLFGNRGRDTHPWRRFILGVVESLFVSFPLTILVPLYWYTRQTSTGIHLLGTVIKALTGMVVLSQATISSAVSQMTWDVFAMLCMHTGFDLVKAVLILRAVCPFEGTWEGWTPVVRRAVWSKGERLTRRVEGRFKLMYKLALLALLLTFYFFLQYRPFTLIRPLHVPQNIDTKEYPALPKYLLASQSALMTFSMILQLDLNRRLRTFAGSCKLTAYLLLAEWAFYLIGFVPSFIGRYDTRGGIGPDDVVNLGLAVGAAWQAYSYRKVEQVEDEGDE